MSNLSKMQLLEKIADNDYNKVRWSDTATQLAYYNTSKQTLANTLWVIEQAHMKNHLFLDYVFFMLTGNE